MTRLRFFQNQERLRIAYVDEGEGPMVLLPPWWVSHLEHDAGDADYRRFFARLSTRFRVVRYDRVGVGMSDRTRSAFTLASEVADFSALVEHLHAPRFHLLGVSCGGPVALAYAAENPERVERIVLYASYLHGASLSSKEVRAALIALVQANGMLGSRTLADIFHPTASPEARKRFNALQRESADSETAARLLELTYALDARSFAGRVRSPVLVLHRKGDHAIHHDQARTLAASLPGATLGILEGSSHMPWHEHGDALVDAIAEFLGRAAVKVESETEGDAELRREGDVWRLRFDGREALLRHSKGLADLARLLVHPGQEIHVFDLLGVDVSERRDAQRGDLASDAKALSAYRRRLDELDRALEEAEALADLGRKSGLAAERETLLRRLAVDTGLRGRARRLNDPVERARKAVAARLRDAIRRLSTANRAVGTHLESSIQTGIRCVYRPAHVIRWTISPDPS
ncbi:MAG: alpha/beta fold hydrolase [Myxococcaceae bacterium]